jgi:hypothetical protein
MKTHVYSFGTGSLVLWEQAYGDNDVLWATYGQEERTTGIDYAANSTTRVIRQGLDEKEKELAQ